MGKISGKELVAFWYNPKNGETRDNGRFQNTGQQVFTPPTTGYGNDWVLVADDALKNYSKPAEK
jgi:hypothetical protein